MADDLLVRERLRVVGFELHRQANGSCRARIALEWNPSRQYVGTADGLGGETGELRCAAQASLEAISQAVEGRIQFELIGVRAVRAFDAMVVIVSIAAQDEGTSKRLVGSYLAGSDVPRGAAVAVLNATNRLLGNVFARDV